MATIRDVAERAGVAPSTVSHFLTGRVPVSQKTAARIRRAIDELNYVPNPVARSLRSKETKTIGLIVPNVANPFFSEVIRSIGHACDRAGYSLILSDSDEDSQREAHLLETLAQRVDGVLMVHTGKRDDYAQLLQDYGTPVVFLDREVPGHRSIVTNNYEGGKLAARHLLDLGHRHFGVLVGQGYISNVQERLAGFEAELEAAGFSLSAEQVVLGFQDLETGRDIEFLLRRSPRPTAVFATNDIIALGAWHQAHQLGIRIPEDMSLVGYDDIEMVKWTVPPLTTVSQPKADIGRKALLALLDKLEGREETDLTTRLAPRLVIRGSTAPAGEDRERGDVAGK